MWYIFLMTTQEILRKELHIRLIKLINPVLMTGLFFGLWYHYVALTLNDSALIVSIKTGFILAIFFFIYCVMSRLYDAFLISLMRISEVVYGQVISLAISDMVMSVILYLMYIAKPSLSTDFIILLATVKALFLPDLTE